MTRFWNWSKPTDESAERVLEINGTIAEESWFDDDVTPEIFKSELMNGSGPITVYINSPGGDCFAASRIYTMLMEYPFDVTVKIDGIAASAASVIAMAGTTVLMAPTALLMIHNPATIAFGDQKDMQKAIEMLDEVKESIINAYEIKTGLSRVQLSHMMDDETWMNAKRAQELKFCDGMLGDPLQDSESYEFAAKRLERAVACKITGKVVGEPGHARQPAKPEPRPEPQGVPDGRSVDALLAELMEKALL